MIKEALDLNNCMKFHRDGFIEMLTMEAFLQQIMEKNLLGAWEGILDKYLEEFLRNSLRNLSRYCWSIFLEAVYHLSKTISIVSQLPPLV